MIDFDADKDAANIAKHGVSLARAEEFEIAVVIEDDRQDYGEARYLAFGHLDSLAHCLVFAERQGVVRAISLRRAHKKEMDRYVP